MSTDSAVRASKFLSLVLRHKPEAARVTLDANGWASIDAILKGAPWLTREMIDLAVAENAKQRFSVSEDGTRIRARQGHSINVDVGLEEAAPPAVLYHGTYPGAMDAIRREGLLKMKRQHVHMADERQTASSVGMRRGAPIVLRIQAVRMHQDGFKFFRSENGVWLTDHVPSKYLEFPTFP
jgi:putative RNA 2'-phosphotransferase